MQPENTKADRSDSLSSQNTLGSSTDSMKNNSTSSVPPSPVSARVPFY